MELNKIYNEDCLVGVKRIPDNSVDISFTSPPYNRIRNDKYSDYTDVLQDYYKMLVDITDEMLRVTKKDVIVNVQMQHFNKVEILKYLGHYSEKIKGIVIWEKTNPEPQRNYREKDKSFSVTNAYEYFIVMNDNDASEFRAYGKIKNIIKSSVNSERFEGHGAVMKYEVAEYFIKNFTEVGDVILDPFMGMGTTAVACISQDRKYVGFELSENYIEKAKRRIKAHTTQVSLFDYM